MTATREEIAAASVAKSDQLNAEDLISGPLMIEIEDVNVIQGDKGVQKMIIRIKDREHPWHTCKSVTRTILAMWPEEPVEWIGRKMILFRDPDVLYKNDALGGIRIQAASDLSADFTLTLTEHQKKRITRTIKPLQAAAPKQKLTIAARVARAVTAYDACTTGEELMVTTKKCEPLAAECDAENKAKMAAAYEAAMARVNHA